MVFSPASRVNAYVKSNASQLEIRFVSGRSPHRVGEERGEKSIAYSAEAAPTPPVMEIVDDRAWEPDLLFKWEPEC